MPQAQQQEESTGNEIRGGGFYRVQNTLIRIGDVRHKNTGKKRRGTVLSRREHEVALLWVMDRPVKQISADLAIAKHTVNRHVEQIYIRLGTYSRLTTLQKLAQLGIIDINEWLKQKL